MNHISIILDRLETIQGTISDQRDRAAVAGERAEDWDNNHPQYAALMAKQDETVDLINDFAADLEGKIADIENITQ